MMQAWIRNRAKTRKDGRTVIVTSVSFDVQVFEQLCNRVHRERQRSTIVTEAIRHVLAIPGWVEATLAGQPMEPAAKPPRDAPSSNSQIHARGGVDGPTTKKSPSRNAAPSKRGTSQPRK